MRYNSIDWVVGGWGVSARLVGDKTTPLQQQSMTRCWWIKSWHSTYYSGCYSIVDVLLFFWNADDDVTARTSLSAQLTHSLSPVPKTMSLHDSSKWKCIPINSCKSAALRSSLTHNLCDLFIPIQRIASEKYWQVGIRLLYVPNWFKYRWYCGCPRCA